MESKIYISTSCDIQKTAALSLSQSLQQLNCKHAFIGGFAWSLLGSDRRTLINVLVEPVKDLDIQALRQKLTEVNEHIVSAGLKLYFVQELVGNLQGEELVRAAKNNVLIETLQTGTLGLPQAAEPQFLVRVPSGDIPLLHPSILILTKLKRWYMTSTSTRPKTVTKTGSDEGDIDYMVSWLARNQMKIEFEGYKGKSKDQLMVYVRQYHACKLSGDDSGTKIADALRVIVKTGDWELLEAIEPSVGIE